MSSSVRFPSSSKVCHPVRSVILSPCFGRRISRNAHNKNALTRLLGPAPKRFGKEPSLSISVLKAIGDLSRNSGAQDGRFIRYLNCPSVDYYAALSSFLGSSFF